MKVNELSKLCKIMKLVERDFVFDMGANETWNVDGSHVSGLNMQWDIPLTDHPHMVHVDSLTKGLVCAKPSDEVYFPKHGESHTIGRITYLHNICPCESDTGKTKKTVLDEIRKNNRCIAKIMKNDILPFFKNNPKDDYFNIWSLNGKMGISETSIGYVDLGKSTHPCSDTKPIWSNIPFDLIRRYLSLLPNVELTLIFDTNYPLIIDADLGFVKLTYTVSPRISCDETKHFNEIKITKKMIGIGQ